MKDSILNGLVGRLGGVPLGKPGELVEYDMTKRLSRRELTARIQALERKVREGDHLQGRMMEHHKGLSDEVDNSVSYKRFKALVEFLGLESEYVCSTDGHYKFRRKQSARANKKQTKEKK